MLTNDQGRTLYSLSAENNGKFICTGSCLSAWHPLIVPAGVKPTGPVKLGTIKRPEGGTQVTYKGRPLYRFSGDTKAGEANGEGIKDVGTWHAATRPAPRPNRARSHSRSPKTRTATYGPPARFAQRERTASIVCLSVARASWCGIQCSLRRARAVSISTGPADRLDPGRLVGQERHQGDGLGGDADREVRRRHRVPAERVGEIGDRHLARPGEVVDARLAVAEHRGESAAATSS